MKYLQEGNNLRSRLVVLALAFFILLSFIPNVLAQSGSGGSGLSVSPTRTELRINPGGSDVVRINLRNVTGGDITAKAFINDFEPDNASGEPRIVLNSKEASPTSIKNFLAGVGDVQLKQGESKTFDVTVVVPADTAPGAYYGVIRYAAVPLGNDAPEPGQVSLTASVATIILIEVAGDIHEQVELNSVRIYSKDKSAGLFTKRPDQIGVEVTNKGNGFARPFGTVSVRNPFGKQAVNYEVNDTEPRGNVLPGSSRIFKNNIKGINWPGRYKVTASISFGNGGEVLIRKASFWYLPLWFIVLVLLALFGAAALIYKIRNRLPRTRHRR